MRIYKLFLYNESEKSQNLLQTSSFDRLNDRYLWFIFYDLELNEMERLRLFKIFIFVKSIEFFE